MLMLLCYRLSGPRLSGHSIIWMQHNAYPNTYPNTRGQRGLNNRRSTVQVTLHTKSFVNAAAMLTHGRQPHQHIVTWAVIR